jgi:hypothetical protein
MDPVLDSRAVYLGVNVFLTGDLDEDQQRVVVSVTNFGSQSDVGESFYKDSELLSCFSLTYIAQLALLKTQCMSDVLVVAKRKTMT